MNIFEEIREKLKHKIHFFDGAMGTEINKYDISKEDYKGYELGDYLNITRPDIIEKIHLEYIKSGCDIIETNTFNSNEIVLKEHKLEKELFLLNQKAVEIAKSAIKKAKTDRKIYICGSIGPTNIAPSLNHTHKFDDIKNSYKKQIEALLKSGVDFLIFETAHDIINIKAGLVALYEITGTGRKMPAITSVTVDSNGIMLSGHNIDSAYVNLSNFELIAFGINCSTGPDEMYGSVKRLNEISSIPVFIMPNAGFPDENGKYTKSPEDFADTIKNLAKKGWVNIAGGCCGTTPSHIKELVNKLKNIPPRELKIKKYWAVAHKQTLFYEEIEPPVIIAERTNVLGSKKFRKLVDENRKDEIISLAKKQVEKGAHIIDISFTNPERNEIKDINEFLPVISKSIRIPLMIDSTNTNSFEESLKLTGAKLILNSVNFENGEDKAIHAIELNKKYGAKIVFGLIDENKDGLSLSLERKIEILERGIDFFIKKHKLSTDEIIVDPLVFPISVGKEYRKAAVNTLKAVEIIKKKYKLKTILGISNISFGFKPDLRKMINSVFLHHAVKMGLDFAIVNIEGLIPYALIDRQSKKLIEDLIFTDDESAMDELMKISKNKSIHLEKKEKNLSLEEKLKENILKGINEDTENILNELLNKMKPQDIINSIIIETMKEVGKLFSNGDLIVTEVLASSEVVHRAIEILKPHITNKKDIERGTILLATVKGDVHDIGKNLVSIIFESNGFKVVDLGTKVEPELIVKKAIENNVDFIGLSGLLVRSCYYMEETAKLLSENNISVPLLCGGAALGEKFVENNIKPVYKGKVYYAKDAIDGLNKAINSVNDTEKEITLKNRKEKEIKKESTHNITNTKYLPESIPTPESLERFIFKNYDLNTVFDNINWDLFYLRFLNLKKSQSDKIQTTEKEILKLKEEIIKNKYIEARGIYQIFKAASDKNHLLIFDKNNNLIDKILLPRQSKKPYVSITDFIMPLKDNNPQDYVGFLISSCFLNNEKIEELEKNKEIKKIYLIKSLALMLAEAFTEILHYFIRKNLGIEKQKELKNLHKQKYQGIRYSPGYPALKDISINQNIYNILKASEIGTKITTSYMLDPESSVGAIALHNPKAFYFG